MKLLRDGMEFDKVSQRFVVNQRLSRMSHVPKKWQVLLKWQHTIYECGKISEQPTGQNLG